ncbi:MAG: hypothetical protein N2689_12940 [Verrucomicrobiae bacterium]|nr:hypothetical protein [Verrucomicrobiae bacterium]
MSHRERFRDIEKRLNANWALYPRMAHECFTPVAFARGRQLLDDARKTAKDDATALARVEFLQKGLTHAEKCAAASRARASGDFLAIQDALNDLRSCRRQIERDNVANLAYCAWIESRAFGEARRAVAYTGEPLRPIAEKVASAELKPISLRGDFGFLALLGAQETFRATIAIRKVGKNNTPASWTLVGPNQVKLAAGTVEPGKTCELEVAAPAKGVYNLILTSANNAALTTLHNDYAVILGRDLGLIHASGPMWFYVPLRTRSFTVTLKSPAPGETARITIHDPDGREVASGFTGPAEKAVLNVKVPAGQDGKAWSVVPSCGPAGVMEDYSIILGEELPPYWAQAPDRLLVPDKQGNKERH